MLCRFGCLRYVLVANVGRVRESRIECVLCMLCCLESIRRIYMPLLSVQLQNIIDRLIGFKSPIHFQITLYILFVFDGHLQ